MAELRELRQLREQDQRLKRLVADLTLDKHIPAGSLVKKESKAFRPKTEGKTALRLVHSTGAPNARPETNGRGFQKIVSASCGYRSPGVPAAVHGRSTSDTVAG